MIIVIAINLNPHYSYLSSACTCLSFFTQPKIVWAHKTRWVMLCLFQKTYLYDSQKISRAMAEVHAASSAFKYVPGQIGNQLGIEIYFTNFERDLGI